MYKRVLLKLSGEALSSKESVYDLDTLNSLAKQIKKIVSNNIQVGIVVGGGNIVRGRTFEALGFGRVAADKIGMLGTVCNALTLKETLINNGVKAEVMSPVAVAGVEAVDIEKANKLFKEKYVIIFGGGVGEPFFSTDTACALRASEIKADVILMAKSGVDGVYDSDPKTNPKAKRFSKLSFDDILRLDLKVIDSTAASLLKDNKINAFVFDMAGKDNLVKAAKGDVKGTLIVAK